MVPQHPKTVEALALGRAFVHTTGDLLERVDRIRARRPSPSGRVIPEVDARGRLTALYIAPGTIATAKSGSELAADIMAAIRESTTDAARQFASEIHDTVWPENPDVPWVRRR